METSEKKQLHEEIKRRGITRVVHITPVQNLKLILQNPHGLVASAYINNKDVKINDHERWDRHTGFVCCSLEYPNYYYYERVSKPILEEPSPWVVLEIDPEVICRNETRFCPTNAAFSKGAYVNKGFDWFQQLFREDTYTSVTMFGKRTKTTSRVDGMPENLPTDIQAEIMPFKNVPLDNISAILFNDMEVLEQTKAELEENKIPYPKLVFAQDILNESAYRDYQAGGDKPEETVVCEGRKNYG